MKEKFISFIMEKIILLTAFLLRANLVMGFSINPTHQATPIYR